MPGRLFRFCLAVGALVGAGLACSSAWADEPLLILYYEREPYHYTRDGRPAGLLVERLDAAAAEAHVALRYERVPGQRIINDLSRQNVPVCALGWGKTPERLRTFRFSAGLYRDLPLRLVAHASLAPALEAEGSIAALLDDPRYTLAAVQGLSYGPELDARIAVMKGRIDRNLTLDRLLHTPQNARRLKAGHVHYTFVTQEEWPVVKRRFAPELNDFVMFNLAGMPDGGTRHLMCSVATDESVLSRLSAALAARYPELDAAPSLVTRDVRP